MMGLRTTLKNTGILLAVLSACTTPPSEDVSRTDASADMVVPSDGTTVNADAGDGREFRTHPACDSVIDLNTEGMRTDAGANAGLRWTGSNSDTNEGIENALQPNPSGRCTFRAIKQRLFRYRMQGNGGLRASTNNAGSDATFDSSIFITSLPCSPDATVLACNDDDPFAPPNPHITLSNATAPALAAGTEVIISVSGFYPAMASGQQPNPAGEVGNFVLTVNEVPARAEGESCDLRGLNDVCPADAHCLADAMGRGRCVRDGSTAGSRCTIDGSCSMGLQCDLRQEICYATATESMPCERFDGITRCGDGLSCVSALRGQRAGRCVRNGTAQAACGQGMGMPDCAAGLRCSAGRCRPLVAAGAPCNSNTDACIEGQSCVANTPGGAIGRCVADGSIAGSLCRPGASECDPGLFCIANGGDRFCRGIGRTDGDRCDNGDTCSFEIACVTMNPPNPYEAECRTAGGLNTSCANDAACRNGMRCVGRTMNNPGRCLPIRAANDACDVYRQANACDSGLSCVREANMGSTGRCVPTGSAAGAACRGNAPSCDMGLTCANDLGSRCVRAASGGQPCDPRFASTRCAAGTLCRATNIDNGSCESPTAESEPNDQTMGLTARATPVVMSGALSRFDIDCNAITVAQGGAIFAQAVNGNGACNSNFVLDLYREDGTWLGSDADSGPFGCPRIDGTANAFATSLSAGNYVVCLREGNGNIIGSYALSLNASR